jgi:hypothetical protein
MNQPDILKTLTLSFLGAAAVLTVSSCTTVLENPVPTTTTTTTERAEVHHPFGTTETKTTRTY